MTEPAGELRRWALAHTGTIRGRAAALPAAEEGPGPGGPIRLDVSDRVTRLRVADPGFFSAASVAWTTTDIGQPLLATGSDEGTVGIWDPVAGTAVTTLTGHTGAVRSVAWTTTSTGQSLLATGSLDGTARIWDPVAGTAITTLTGHTGAVWSVAWTTTSTGQSLLATASFDGTARIWDPVAGTAITTLTGHTGLVYSVAWTTTSTGQSLLATASFDGTVRIWDPVAGTAITTLTGHTSLVYSVAWTTTSTGQSLLASAGDDGTVRIWDPVAGTAITTLTGHISPVRSVAWTTTSTGQSLLASAGNVGTARIWNPEIGEPLATVEHATRGLNAVSWRGPGQLRFSADAGGAVEDLQLATAGDNGEVWIHEMSCTAPVGANSVRSRTATAFPRPSGGALAAVPPGAIQPTGPDPDVLTGHTALVWSVAWITTDTGQPLLATGSEDGTARIWNPQTGQTITTLTGPIGAVRSVAWTTTDTGQTLLATGSYDGTARIWNPVTGATITTLTGHTGAVWSVAWITTATGQPLLATGSDDGTARIWNPQTGQTITTLTGHTALVLSVAWITTDTGQPLLATGSGDGTARIWNPQTGQTITTLTGHIGRVLSVAWITTDTGQPLLATAADDGTARIWNPVTGATITTLTGHTGTVWSVAWTTTSAGQALIATAGEDDTARIWDPHTSATIRTLVHPDAVNAVAWRTTPAGALTLTTGCDDNNVREFTVMPASADVTGRPAPPVAGGVSETSVKETMPGLLALGRRGLWPPWGLVEDLVRLTGTGRTTALNDPELDTLARHPVVAAMRDLDWPAASRVAMAALLVAGHDHDPGFAVHRPVDPVTLAAALTAALTDPARANTPPLPTMPVPAVRAAADAVPSSAVDLLAILGPEVSAEDPSLVLRLAGSAARLPALDPRIRSLLSGGPAGGPGPKETHALPTGAGPERIGDPLLARSGDPHHLIATHLALPTRQRAALAAAGNLLYRRRSAEPNLRPADRILVLDTSPPTYGPVEAVLRLVAHLVTTELRRADATVTLLTAERPDSLIPLRHARDLLHLWTGRTLVRPDLTALVATAAGQGQPVIVLAHYETARWAGLIRSLDHQVLLLTVHTPSMPEPHPTAVNHHHLAPTATADQIETTVHALLIGQTWEPR